MGLDMYAVSIAKDDNRPATDFKLDDDNSSELHYWRKHPNLHGWMESLYNVKGGENDDFNCNTVLITEADLNNLEKVVKARTLPETSGFFFGQTTGEEYEDDLEFIRKAREVLAQSRQVAYYAWW
jgi:hypothetical protein